MYENAMSVLHCAEYNFKKLKKYRGEPESPEQALRWRLEGGITKCIETLLMSEKYSWTQPATGNCACPWNQKAKKTPKKLRKILSGLINNSDSGRTEQEQVEKLKGGIRNVSTYLLNIKADQNYLNSKVLKNVYEYLQSLLEMEPPQIIKTYNPEGMPVK
ncbi:MAG: hypothetical protein WCS27_01910 [Victivallaceae bacterium]